jgi:hypothetical protein
MQKICFFIALIYVYHAQAQNRVGPETDIKSNVVRYIGSFGDKQLILTHNKKNMFVAFIDASYNMVNSIKFLNKKKDGKLVYSNYIDTGRKKALILGLYKKKNIIYSAFSLNEDGTVAEKIELTSLEHNSASKYVPVANYEYTSDSTKHALIINSTRYTNPNQTSWGKTERPDAKTHIQVFDKNLQKLWSRTITFTHDNQIVGRSYFEVMSSKLAPDGQSVYISVKILKKLPNVFLYGYGDYDVSIYKIYADKAVADEIKINIGQQDAKAAHLMFDKENNLVCLGFFGDREKNSRASGLFAFKINADGEILSANKRHFTTEEFEALGRENTNNAGLTSGFSFKNLITRPDGSMVLAVEESYVFVYTTPSYGNARGSTDIYYNHQEILLIIFTPTLSIDKILIIPKRQTANTRIFNSFQVFQKGDDLYFLYNENKNNIEQYPNIEQQSLKNTKPSGDRSDVPTFVRLDINNKLTRKAIPILESAKLGILPAFCHRVDENTIFFIAVDNGPLFDFFAKQKHRFGTIKIE